MTVCKASDASRGESYALVTAAYNEAGYIGNTIRSVISQEVRPVKWVIVSDGSTDQTDAIVEEYAAKHSFIQLYRLTDAHPRNFEAQANAINAGIAQLRTCPYRFIGNLDADVTFEPEYFRLLLNKFRDTPQLGLGGGLIYERGSGGEFKSRRNNKVTSVAHAVQLFRRECFDAVGARYQPLPYGAPDTYAEVTARMKGWHVSSFPDLKVFHHRPTSSAGGRLRGCFRQGRMDYSLGILPIYEVAKSLNRMRDKPYIFGAITRFGGFAYSHFQNEQRPVSREFIAYFRREQASRLISCLPIGKRSDAPVKIEHDPVRG